MTISLIYFLAAPDPAFARMLNRALQLETWRLFLSRRERLHLRRGARARAGVMIYGFDHAQFDDAAFPARQAALVGADTASVKIFLQLASSAVQGAAREDTDRKNRIIAEMARACGGHVVLTADLMQTGSMQRLKKSGRPNLYGFLALAHVVIRAIKARTLRDAVPAGRTSGEETPDASAAVAQLVWKHPHLPAGLTNGYDREEIEDLLEGRLSFWGYRHWGKLPLGEPIEWARAGPNMSWQSYFNGLDFLRAPLAFWFEWTSGHARRPAPIAEALRAGGHSPDECLVRAAAIAADFVRRNPPERPANPRAYIEGTVSRRVKSLLLLLLCCRRAEERGTAIDADHIALAWRGLTDGLSMLQNEEIYPKAGNHGVRQDSLFILVGLLFPELRYAQRLGRLGETRLQRHQLGNALSADGVWLENSLGYHCLVMNMLNDLASDLRDAGAPALGKIHDALARMWPFAQAMVKPDGTAPLLGDTAPRYMFNALADVRRELDRAGGKDSALDLRSFERAELTYLFPDAGYFASHSARALAEDSSTLIFMANLSTPKHKQSDDLSVVFSRGAHDLLVDGGTYNKEVSDSVRNAARFDPGSHNSLRVNGGGYPLRAGKGRKPAGLDGMWEGVGWAAALGHNHAYPDARVSRLVIHLKQHHALIVLDRLASKTSSAVQFEQFWHLAPDLAPPATPALPWTFASANGGNLLVAFDNGPGGIAIEHGGPDNPIAWLMLSEDKTVPTPYLRRMLRSEGGVMASLFQSSDKTAEVGEIEVRFAPASRGRIEIAATGAGFACRFLASDDNVECLELNQRE